MRASIAGMTNGTATAAPGLRERRKLRTRATLVDAAVGLCHKQGYERTTVEQIAALAAVSPRTFSRYFATKDAVVLACIDDMLDIIATKVALQPAHLDPLQTLYRSNVEAIAETKTVATNGVTAERLLASARIITTSAALMQSAREYRTGAIEAALAQRMGVSVDDMSLQMVGAVWSAIIFTALIGMASVSDWDAITVDDIIERIEHGYGHFAAVAGPVKPAL